MRLEPRLPADAEDRLRQIFAAVLGVRPEEAPAQVSGENFWSSLAHLLLISEIEREFDVALTNAEIAAATSYDALVRLLARRMSASSPTTT
jgi:acyl carrier protein